MVSEMEPEEIKKETENLKQKFKKRHNWNFEKTMLSELESEAAKVKIHRDCGGIVVYREPDSPTWFAYAGYCLKCEAFPIYEEDIIKNGETS
jgi:hypothetical protein